MADKLTEKLETIILQVEDKLWLGEKNQLDLSYSQVDLQGVLHHVKSRYGSLSPVERIGLLKSVTDTIEPLYKISAVCTYKEENRLKYQEYSSLDKVRDVLIIFTAESSINVDAITSCNIVADVLTNIDDTRPNYKNALSYKYLRAFLLFVLLGDYVSAACIATFILTQLGV